MHLVPGQTVDRYVVEQVLGSGGMATVYAVRHTRLGTRHALKVLGLTHPSIRARLVQEGRIQGSLKHPNVVTVTDLVDVQGAPGLIMELVEGPTLRDMIATEPLTLPQVDAIARQLLAGVAAAHARQLVHRDLKPANVLLEVLGDQVVAKITDFGLAKILRPDDAASRALTRTGASMGTPPYMAPEQVHDASDVDHRADLFALGAILFELCTGRRAFVGHSAHAILARVAEGIRPRVTDVAPDLPPRMVAAIEGALVVDRDARIQDCAALLATWTDGASLPDGVWDAGSLDRARTSSPGSFPTLPSAQLDTPASSETWATPAPESAPIATAPPSPWPRRALWGGGAALLGVAAVAAWALWPPAIATARYLDIEPVDGGWRGVGPVAEDASPGLWWEQTTEGGRVVRLERHLPVGLNVADPLPPIVVQTWEGGALVGVDALDGAGTVVEGARVERDADGLTVWFLDREGGPQRDARHGVYGERWTVDADGRPLEARFLRPDGAPMRSTEGAWGERVTRDAQGRPVAQTRLDRDGQPAPDAHGVVEERFTYGDARFPTQPTTRSTHGYGGVLVAPEDGCATRALEYADAGDRRAEVCLNRDGAPRIDDELGCHRVEVWWEGTTQWTACYDPDGQPIPSRMGWTRFSSTTEGHHTTLAFRDAQGAPTTSAEGYAVTNLELDDAGHIVQQGPYLDMDGAPVPGPDGVGRMEHRFDARGEVEAIVYDVAGNVATGPDGWAIRRVRRDALGREVQHRLYDVDAQPLLGPHGYHRMDTVYDSLGLVAEERYYDTFDRPVDNWRGFATRIKVSHPALLQTVEDRYLNARGEPTVDKKYGAARIVYTLDDHGRMTGVAHYGPDGAPIEDDEGAVRWEYLIRPDGVITGKRSLDADGNLRPTTEGWAEMWFTRDRDTGEESHGWLDAHGAAVRPPPVYCARIDATVDPWSNLLSTACADEHGLPLAFAAPVGGTIHRRDMVYDANSRLIEERNTGVDGKPTLNYPGWARATFTYDVRGNVVEERAYDVDGALHVALEGWAIHRIAYDDRGHETDHWYFDEDGNPSRGRVCACHHMRLTPNARGHLLVREMYGADGALVPGLARMEYERDLYGRETERRRYGPDGAPYVSDDGAWRVITAFDDDGKPTRTFLAPDGTVVDR